MNTLTFQIKAQSNNGRIYVIVEIFIDGVNLIDLLKEYELPYAEREGSPQIAGAYVGLAPQVLYRQLTRNVSEGWPESKRNIYACSSCHEEGCWPMFITIKTQGDQVIWEEFEQPHRKVHSKVSAWNYSGFGPFVFEKSAYLQAVESLKVN